MNAHTLETVDSAVADNSPISSETALALLESGPADLPSIIERAWRVRHRHHGSSVHLCAILNAKSGSCSEDCAFCAQSAHNDIPAAQTYPLHEGDQIADAYQDASQSMPIGHFGIVTSGETLESKELDRVTEVIDSHRGEGAAWCASLGCLERTDFDKLKQAGLKRFHHNLETAESFFPQVCTTHSYADRLRTLHDARAAGLEVCSGGILGMGESLEQRVELALTLQQEQVDSIPLNFLVPVKGARMENIAPLRPLEILRCVAMFRLTNPTAEIKVCAGRGHLRDLQSMIFYAGATGMMVGNLLTIAGRDVQQDLQMVKDLELDHGQ